jgi:hypothetical protein
MKKLLYIAPHLSTGGLPQYLTKKIELLNDKYLIYVIEYEDITGGVLVVHKNKIKNLIGDRLITIPWGGDKQNIIKHINIIQPDIIHLEEMPEYFMDDDIAKQIYTTKRRYKIFETSHDSSFNTNNKRFTPDKLILVSNYQLGMLKDLNIPMDVVEYPIEDFQRPNREDALKKLGLDPSYQHVLHVGLFTPRKNQQEFFEYAEHFLNDRVIFHCVGNMADNFRSYWEPLIANKPTNVVVHGEKSNVGDFYGAMDLFLFTSKGHENDKETMPLVLKEAISWHMPTLIYNLPVYENYFDKFETVNYLDFNDFTKNLQIINQKLGFSNKLEAIDNKEKKTVVVISTYTVNDNLTDLTLEAINAVKGQGYDVILTSHAPIPTKLQENVNHAIFDSGNILVYHDFYGTSWTETDEYRMTMNIRTENNHIYHGPAVYTNYYNGIHLANSLGYDNAICFNYDMFITDEKVIPTLINYLKSYKAVFNHTNALEGHALRTVLFATKTDFFCGHFPLIKNGEEYNKFKEIIGSESNGLENMFYHTLKNVYSDIKILDDKVFYDMLSECKIDICSMVEYFNVLPIADQPNKFAVWYSTSNNIDNRTVHILVDMDGGVVDQFYVNVTNKQSFYRIFNFKNGDKYRIAFTDGGKTKIINIDDDYFYNKLKNNGELKLK